MLSGTDDGRLAVASVRNHPVSCTCVRLSASLEFHVRIEVKEGHLKAQEVVRGR